MFTLYLLYCIDILKCGIPKPYEHAFWEKIIRPEKGKLYCLFKWRMVDLLSIWSLPNCVEDVTKGVLLIFYFLLQTNQCRKICLLVKNPSEFSF